mgnify:CR=1 FL=1
MWESVFSFRHELQFLLRQRCIGKYALRRHWTPKWHSACAALGCGNAKSTTSIAAHLVVTNGLTWIVNDCFLCMQRPPLLGLGAQCPHHHHPLVALVAAPHHLSCGIAHGAAPCAYGSLSWGSKYLSPVLCRLTSPRDASRASCRRCDAQLQSAFDGWHTQPSRSC